MSNVVKLFQAKEPIKPSRTVDIPAKQYRNEIEWLASLTRDYCAYTSNERKTEQFQNFLTGLEERTRHVAALYCKRSKKDDDFKLMTLNSANSILERNGK